MSAKRAGYRLAANGPLAVGPKLVGRGLDVGGVDDVVEGEGAGVVAALAEVIQVALEALAGQAAVRIEPGHLHAVVDARIFDRRLLGQDADDLAAPDALGEGVVVRSHPLQVGDQEAPHEIRLRREATETTRLAAW